MITVDPIEAVSAAFSDVSKPSSIDACPCCVDRENINKLLSTPLKDLTSEDLDDYTVSVL